MNHPCERRSTSLWHRAVSFCLAALMLLALLPGGAVRASAASAGDTLYLKPNSNWLEAGARFAAYFYVGTNKYTWVSMTDTDGDGYYACKIPEGGYTNVIFARMNPGTTANNWNNMWTQTGDLGLNDGNCYTINDGSWDSGTWSTCYSLRGTMNSWSATENLMTVTGTNMVSVTLRLEAGEYTFKITDGTIWYGNDGTIEDTTTATSATGWVMDSGADNCTLKATGGIYTFSFNTSTKTLVLLHSVDLEPEEIRTIYFDATLSKLRYDGDTDAVTANGIPGEEGIVYFYAIGDGLPDKTGTLSLVGDANYPDLYSVDLDVRYDQIIFAGYQIRNLQMLSWYGESTPLLTIPEGKSDLCFYADSSDDVVYYSKNGNVRDGYWGEARQLRSAEYMKQTDVVDIPSGTLVQDSEILYVPSTFYDYYTDYELNGYNRDSFETLNNDEGTFATFQNWYPFRHFDQALSDYYESASARVPIYVGHFQPDWNDEYGNPWGYQFKDIADTLNLYGFMDGKAYGSDGNMDQKWFMSVNNSVLDLDWTTDNGNSAAQGIVADGLSDGTVIAAGTNVELPFFNEAFLEGSNSKNTKLGEVFENVAFPFTQQDTHNDGIEYWVFDSSKTTLTMMDNSDEASSYKYYLEEVTDAATREKYRNVDAGSNPTSDYGFFPFNSGATVNTVEGKAVPDAGTYNYGFGASMSLTFNLTETGTVTDKYGNEKPIIFEFSGDDDLWIFLDDQLVLDIGGSHGKVDGSINFQTMKATVSSVKSSGGSDTSGTDVEKAFTLKGKNTDNHTLTLFYMERGMWESNMHITFNFFPAEELLPETTSMTVTKDWDLEAGATTPDSIKVRLQRTAEGTGNWTKVGSDVTLTADGGWTYTFADLEKYTDSTKSTAYAYRVVELNGSKVLSEGDMANGLIVSYGPVYGNAGTGYGQLITNSTPPAGLTITKQLAENSTGSWTGGTFPVQVMLNGSPLAQGTELTTTSGEKVVADENGVIYLKAGDSVTLDDLEAGTTYVVTELDTDADSVYMSSYDVSTTAGVAPVANANQVSGTLSGQSSTTVTITNSYRSAHVVVIDYGLSVDVDVMEKDLAELGGSVYKIGASGAAAQGFGKTPGNAFTTGSVAGTHGTLTIAEGKLRYTPKEKYMEMETEDVFSFVIEFDAPDGGTGYYYSTLTVIPATTIYYEDGFLTYSVIDDDNGEPISDYGWTTVGDTQDKIQAEDRPGPDVTELDADNIYGYDGSYTAMTEYSLGSAMMVNVGYKYNSKGTAVKVTHNGVKEHLRTAAIAEFTFSGTGFDVVSLTSSTTGTILVEVDGIGTANADFFETYIVDTYYGYKLVNGEWVVDEDATGALYQIPVMKVDGLTYGKYTVKILASHAELFDHGQYATKDNYDFYLDAIRIYDPANDGKGNEVIEDAYVADGEGWPEYFELRDLLIDANDFNSLSGSDQATGIVFIDNTKDSTGKVTYSISDYKNYGPNNELYLAENQSVTFTLNVGEVVNGVSNVAGIHIAMKSTGGTANALIKKIPANSSSATTVLDEKIETATDLYYDITGGNGYTVVIQNTGSNILSITNIKVTYKSEHVDSIENSYFRVTKEGVDQALKALQTERDQTTTAGDVTLKGATLSLVDEIHYNIYFDTEVTEEAADMGLLVWESKPAAATYETAETVYAGATYDSSQKLYYVSTDGVAAKNMGDSLYFVAYAKKADGTYVYSQLLEYSAKQYATNILSKSTNDDMKNLCIALLNYGAAAQTYFNYRTGSLMNADLTDNQKKSVAYSADMITAVPQVTKELQGFTTETLKGRGATMTLGGALAVNYLFTLPRSADQVTLYYWTAADYNSAATLTTSNASGSVEMNATELTNQYKGRVEDLVAKSYDDPMYVAAVYKVGNTSYCTEVMAYSMSAYCAGRIAKSSNANMVSLAKALVAYGYYAKAYFGT